MPDYKLIGHDYTLPDMVAKVTGQAKYTEDRRADGMLYGRLLRSPMPHARVRSIDASEALKMPGVRAVLTADDLPPMAEGGMPGGPPPGPPPGRGVAAAGAPAGPPPSGAPAAAIPPGGAGGGSGRRGQQEMAVNEHGQPIPVAPGATPQAGRGGAAPVPPAGTAIPQQPALTNEPMFEGEPILAVAAVDEATAVAAIGKIKVVYEPLPFVLDPLESLRPGGPNARLQGNVAVGNPFMGSRLVERKWTEADFAEAKAGRMPMGQMATAPAGGADASPMAAMFSEQWTIGDVEAGLKEAALVVDESFVVATTPNMPLETRSAMAYWQNGKLYVYCSTQSLAQTVPAVARWAGVDPTEVVVISEYTGGAYGNKNPATPYAIIPIQLAKKTGQPVMLRITPEDETAVGTVRSGMVGRARVGFAKDGRITAVDLFLVGDGGPYGRSDHAMSGQLVSVLYQPKTMRSRGITVLTNTLAHGAQRGPSSQFIPVMEQVISKAARQLGIDPVAIHRVNAPAGKASVGPPQPDGSRRYVTMSNTPQALDRGAELFQWAERKQRSGKRQGSKVRGVGVAVGAFGAGAIGYDGLCILKPDGQLYIQSGCGNLGTHSNYDTTRAAAEALGMPWEKVVVTQGDSSKHLPWSCPQGGSATLHGHTRANWAAGLDATRKLQEIAARDLGGRPEDYEVGNERVSRKGSPGRGLTFAQAAARAVALGGQYDGHEVPADLNVMTKQSAAALAGQGLMGVARDTFPHDGDTMTFVASFAEVEVDVETGEAHVTDCVAVADCGIVVHPRSWQGQLCSGCMMGLSHALYHREVYDRQYGASLATRFYHHKPASIMDAPAFQCAALNIPDPQTPIGARGIAEPPFSAAYGAVVNALIDAIGDEAFRRSPVSPDIILSSLEAGGKWVHEPLVSHI